MKEGKYYKESALLFSTFIIAICGLIYELLAGTLSSYLLGDSIYQFSLTIGFFMSAMGVGAWLSRFIKDDLPRAFIYIQIAIAILGGVSAEVLFFAFSVIHNYYLIFFMVIISLGAMIGIEIPLVIRILEKSSLRENLSNVFTADYIGALFAALIFPIVLLPKLGVMQTSFFVGFLNICVALLAWFIFVELKNRYKILLAIIATNILLFVGFFSANSVMDSLESRLYKGNIIYTKTTKYQRLTITKNRDRVRFFINGALQFDSIDEYRYHEMLVHPAMNRALDRENILILGGGDGLALREILKYKDVKSVIMVDLDPEVTKIFRSNLLLTSLNKNSLNSKKLTIINKDAWKFLQENQNLYDIIIIDLPDPNNISLSRLYTTTFYNLVKLNLSKNGIFTVQSTSPLFAREAFWSIYKSVSFEDNEFKIYPYHVYIPSFGEWGFILASRMNVDFNLFDSKIERRFIDQNVMKRSLLFSLDMSQIDVEPNRLSNHLLIKYYNDGWVKWYE